MTVKSGGCFGRGDGGAVGGIKAYTLPCTSFSRPKGVPDKDFVLLSLCACLSRCVIHKTPYGGGGGVAC